MKEWQASHAARKPEYSDQHLLILELTSNYAPVTEKELGKIFGMSTSSINDLVEKLVVGKLLDKNRKNEGDKREKIITVTETGKEVLKEIKSSATIRFQYLLNRFNDDELKQLINLLEKINESTDESLRALIFQQY